MQPIEIGKIPWFDVVKGLGRRTDNLSTRWFKRVDYHALFAVGADTGPLKLGTTKDVRQRASQLRSDPRAPRWLRVCYWAPPLFARRVLADVTAQLEPVHLGSGWYEVEVAEVEGLVLAAAGKAGIRLWDHAAFLQAVADAKWNDDEMHSRRTYGTTLGPLRPDALEV